MPNSFSKNEKVAFADLLEGFNDALVISRLVGKYSIGDTEAERGSDVIWRPMPSIAQSFDGLDQTLNFGTNTLLSVPSTIGSIKSSHFALNAKELRDGLAENRLAKAARQKLASDINIALMTEASNSGTVVVKRTAAASGYDDISECDSAMNELGIDMEDRIAVLASRDYNSMAGNLAVRQTVQGRVEKAYTKAFVGDIAGFSTYKLDYANRLTAAAAAGVTVHGINQYHVPVSTQASSNGLNQTNVDNRTQNLAITVTGGAVKVGDCFTIAGVNSVHAITKVDTGQLKTFRVMGIVSGAGGTGTIKISPAIVAGAAGGGSDAEMQYQNVTAVPANGAAITWLNTADTNVNPFWEKDTMELLPSRLVLPTNAGVSVLSATTDQGVTVLMSKQASIGTMNVQYRLDVMFGTVMLNPEMAGIMLFNQV